MSKIAAVAVLVVVVVYKWFSETASVFPINFEQPIKCSTCGAHLHH